VRARSVALVAFSDPHLLPPIRNAADALGQRGWDVDVLGIRWRDRPSLPAGFPPATSVTLPYVVAPGWSYHAAYVRFLGWCGARARARRYDAIVAYDMAGAPLGRAMSLACGARFAY